MAPSDNQQRLDDEVEKRLPPDLALLLAAVRAEFRAEVSALKAWGIAMCLGGGFAGGVTATVIELARPGSMGQAISLLPIM